MRFFMGTVDGLMSQRQPLDQNMVFIAPASDLDKAQKSGKFFSIRVDRELKYPDGSPGFVFVRLAYVPNLDAMLAAEKQARKELVADTATIGGATVGVRHSLLDAGRVQDMVDGKLETLGRFLEANPGVLEFRFPVARAIHGLTLDTTSGTWEVTVRLAADENAPQQVFKQTFTSPIRDAHIQMSLDQSSAPVSFARVEIRRTEDPEDASKIHVREIQFA
jgi:hypothetical protein